MLTDQEVARYLGPPIDSRDAVAAHIRTIRERHKADGFGLLAVVLREDGRVIGRSGFLVWDSRTLDRELAMTLRPPPEPGSARREANHEPQKHNEEEGGTRGKHGFPRESERRPAFGRASEAEKEGFEPSRQGFSPPNALAGRRLQPLGHFSGRGQVSAPLFRVTGKSPFRGMPECAVRSMLKGPAPPSYPPASASPVCG